MRYMLRMRHQERKGEIKCKLNGMQTPLRVKRWCHVKGGIPKREALLTPLCEINQSVYTHIRICLN